MSGVTRSRGPIASRSRRRETRGPGRHWTEDWGVHSCWQSHRMIGGRLVAAAQEPKCSERFRKVNASKIGNRS
jgi:hypothetical protein